MTTHTVPCPYPACAAMLPVPATLAPGDYQCICHTCIIKLDWRIDQARGKVPVVTLIEDKKKEQTNVK